MPATAWIRARRREVVVQQRALKVEELALTKVLDEREALEPMPDPTVSARTARTDLDVARALDALPEVAAAA